VLEGQEVLKNKGGGETRNLFGNQKERAGPRSVWNIYTEPAGGEGRGRVLLVRPTERTLFWENTAVQLVWIKGNFNKGWADIQSVSSKGEQHAMVA